MTAAATTTADRSRRSPSDATDLEKRWKSLLGGLRDRIEPVRAGPGYRLGLLLVAATMIVLPVVYVALVGLTCWGVYWYATHAIVMFEAVSSGSSRGGRRGSGRAAVLILIIYLMPIVIGAILVFFMIKPLFARRVVTSHPLSLARGEQPLLFAFVERLCEVVGAPKPSRIDVDTSVNASASFREGWWGFVRKDLVLTIGLPLVAGMDLRMLTGVLAHEFGHFAQGTGMRLTFIIRSINNWFARVVYERDAWDDWLVALSRDSENGVVALIVMLSRLFVWLTRRVLWVLMHVGHAVSSIALRQMEFDADRYEARVSGSDTFAATSERLETLQIAAHQAFDDLDAAWREKRLCDDLPSLIHSRQGDLAPELRKAIAKASAESKTRWFDTHPATADRIRAARREAAKGIFHVDAPAAALFANYDELAKRATVAFYHEALGGQVKREHLVATCTLVEDRGKKKQSYMALRRYCQDLVHPIRPVFPGGEVPRSPERRAEKLLELRGRLADALPRASAAAKAYEKADDQVIAVARARALRGAGERVDAKELGLDRADEAALQAVLTAAAGKKKSAEMILNEVLADAMRRMEIALSLEAAPEAAAPADALAKDEYDIVDAPAAGSKDRLRDALFALRAATAPVESLRKNFYMLGTLGSRLRQEASSEHLVESVLARSKSVAQDLAQIFATLRSTPYPYEHSERNVTLAGYTVPPVPSPEAVGDVHGAAERTLDAFYSLYLRLMSDLARRAEAVESDLGLPPLPEPPAAEQESTADERG